MQFLRVAPTILSLCYALPTSITRREPDGSVLQNKNLHILPLGASITHGIASSDGNGYRKHLRDLLSPASVTFVGTQCGGSMSNANNEGHPGWVINQMGSVAAPNFAAKPNVVLVYVGTNDMKFGDAARAPDAMRGLVSDLTSHLPGSLIVVSKLFPTSDSAVQKRIQAFNDQISGFASMGNVIVADLASALTVSDLSPDGTHPNDGGYSKMAAVFAGVITAAEIQGRIPQTQDFPAQGHLCNGPGPSPAPVAPSSTPAPAPPPPSSSQPSNPASSSPAKAQQPGDPASSPLTASPSSSLSADQSSSTSSSSSSPSPSSSAASTASSSSSPSTISPSAMPTSGASTLLSSYLSSSSKAYALAFLTALTAAIALI